MLVNKITIRTFPFIKIVYFSSPKLVDKNKTG